MSKELSKELKPCKELSDALESITRPASSAVAEAVAFVAKKRMRTF